MEKIVLRREEFEKLHLDCVEKMGQDDDFLVSAIVRNLDTERYEFGVGKVGDEEAETVYCTEERFWRHEDFDEPIEDEEIKGSIGEWTNRKGCMFCDYKYPDVIASDVSIWKCCMTGQEIYKSFGLIEDGKTWKTEPEGVLNYGEGDDEEAYRPEWCPAIDLENGTCDDTAAFDSTPLGDVDSGRKYKIDSMKYNDVKKGIIVRVTNQDEIHFINTPDDAYEIRRLIADHVVNINRYVKPSFVDDGVVRVIMDEMMLNNMDYKLSDKELDALESLIEDKINTLTMASDVQDMLKYAKS